MISPAWLQAYQSEDQVVEGGGGQQEQQDGEEQRPDEELEVAQTQQHSEKILCISKNRWRWWWESEAPDASSPSR